MLVWSVISAMMLLITPTLPLSAPFNARLKRYESVPFRDLRLSVVPQDEPQKGSRQRKTIHGE